MSTVWVTGAAGFIGGRLAQKLAQEGNDVIAIDSDEAFGTRVEFKDVRYTTHLSPDGLLDRLDALKKPAAVFHMGAITNTFEFSEEKLRRANLEYSQKLWEHCTQHGIPFVYASSAATYGDGTLGYDDDESRMHELKPLNPYGESKRLFDLWALDQEKANHTPPTWSGFKFFNVYGFGESHKGRMASVVFHSMKQIQSSGQVTLFKSHKPEYKDGEQKRDFVSVDDVLDVLLFAWKHPIKRGIYNLGTGKARTFLDLARATFAAMGREPSIEFVDTPEAIREKYQYFTQASMDKLRAAGWNKPFLSLEAGVRHAIHRWTDH